MATVLGLELFLYLLSLSILGLRTSDIKKPVTCDAGAYYLGEKAVVTCNFNIDMSTDPRAISVVWYPRNATSSVVEKDVLVCHKKEQKHQKRQCVTQDGYKFGDHIDESLSLEISSVSERTAGLYNCFILPPTGTDSHVCTLSIKAGARPSREKDGNSKLGLIALLIIPAVVITFIVLALWFRRKRRHQMNTSQRRQSDHHLSVPLIPNVSYQPTLPLTSQKKAIEEQLKVFELPMSACQTVMQILRRDLKTVSEAKTDHVYIKPLMQQKAEAAFLVIDLGSSNLKIHHVRLREHHTGIWSEHYTIPATVRLGTETQLNGFIAECVKKFMDLHGLTGKKFRTAFLFSFPCEHEKDLTKARLIKWTKEFNIKGVEGKDPGKLLQKALDEINTPGHLEVKVVLNDAMSTLVSGFYDDAKCKIAVTLANGFYACYVQDNDNLEQNHAGMAIVKADLGAVKEQSPGNSGTEGDKKIGLGSFRTEFDLALDKYSMNPREQILEKMVSIMYLGEIVRLVLVKLTGQGLLFQTVKHKESKLHTSDSFNADYVSLIESDMSQDHFLTRFALEKLLLKDCTDEDCRIVRYVCGVVSERAANLAAAGLATLINHLAKPDITVAIDGPSLNIYHPRFHQLINAKTQELVEPDLKFKIVLTQNGGARGAALVAAAVTS